MKHLPPQTSMLTRISYAWIVKTFLKGYKRELTVSDLCPPLHSHSCSFLNSIIEKHWQKEILQLKENPGSRPSLSRVLTKSFGIQIMINGIFQLIVDAGNRIWQPFLVIKLLSYFSTKNEMTEDEAFFWAAALIFSLFFQMCLSNYIITSMTLLGMKIRIAISNLIYTKVLKTSMIAMEKNTTLGQIINLITNDVNALEYSIRTLNYFWTAPIQAIIVMCLIWNYVSLSATAGTCVFFLFLPVQLFFAMMAPRSLHKAASKTDERLHLINENVNCIQVIKMFAWEKSFVPLVQNVRSEEMKHIKKANFIKLNASASCVYISKLAMLTSFIFCVRFNQFMTAENIFLLTALYNGLQNTMNNLLPMSMHLIANAYVSERRIEEFMIQNNIRYNCKESYRETSANMNCDKTPTGSVNLENISARWSPEMNEETLTNINFVAKCGSLTSVIGQVGSGKSSLLHVILHELPTVKGSVNVAGNIAYVSQDPWIFSSSIRQNILFNLPMDKERYEQVVKVCQLERDFSLFPHNDQTIIGEKGINLSGGQKARVALARAVYQDADIYLLDDPLSAVDTRVGRLIFKKCICNFLKNKTRILVTHQLQYLKDVDYIYVLNEGVVEKEGTYQEMKTSFKNLIVDRGEESVDGGINQQIETDDFYASGTIISDKVQQEQSEFNAFGKISGNVCLAYLKSVGNVWLLFLYIICVVGKQTIISGLEYFISNWATIMESSETSVSNTTNLQLSSVECPETEDDSWWRIDIYSGLLIIALIVTFIETIIFCKISEMASQGLHALMFHSIIRGAMSFFYKTSTGRILNRFSKDLEVVDKTMPKVLNDVVRIFFSVVAVIIFCCIVNYWFFFGIAFLATVFCLVVSFLSKAVRSLKRLDSTTRSPILKHINDTLHGLPTIRACRAEVFLTKELYHHQDIQTSAFALHAYSIRTMRHVSDIISLLFMLIVCYTFLFTRDQNSFGNVGLILTQAMVLCTLLRWGITYAIDVEDYKTSVERIVEFTNIEQEPALETCLDKMPPKDWPKKGCVEFKNVFLKYYHHGHSVLKNLNFIVWPKEKIGIVGRTGAGKSSLVAALFRLANIEGEIIIDGLSTADLGLYDLRSKISIIPQQPFLFSGSLRRNLDPLEEYSDDLVWQALEDVQLKKTVSDLSDGLVTKVLDRGSNFSAGQSQLLCLARAILKGNKILILDEATANIDAETDSLIQKTIRNRFENCTVFIIAHRLNTIMGCDKCMVIDAGRIVEFDHPLSLLDKKEGYLYNMVQQTGTETAAMLRRMCQRRKL